MTHRFADLMFTEAVEDVQAYYGSREHNARLQENFGPNDQLTSREADFIARRDSFYMATLTETGWPYVQHRGGPPGFLKVLSPGRMAFADFRGNTQLVSVGNASGNDRASLILMDYPNRRRLKILGRVRVEDVRDLLPEKLMQIHTADYRVFIERVFTIDVAAFDWNCPQHITQRYTDTEYADLKDKQSRIGEEKNRVRET